MDAALILMFCGQIATANQYRQACDQGFLAASMQSGAHDRITALQRTTEAYAKRNTSVPAQEVIAGVFLAAQGHAQISLGVKPVADRALILIQRNQAIVQLTWTF